MLNLEQKCALLSGAEAFATRGFPQENIPAMLLSDGPNGIRKQAEGANHLGIGGSIPATCFPTAATVANSWDEELAEEVGEALGEEACAQEVGVLLGPGLNMKRSPLCGRNFEYFSEDPYLAGKLAAGYVRGIQKKGVAACPKHYAVNSQELKRMASDSVIDERTLRELYLTGFEITVRESQPMCLMTSYNMINGVYANEHGHLLNEILRGEWGYDGMIVTDWGGSNDHVEGVRATSTLEMPAPGLDPVRELVKAVKEGRIEESIIDARVEELLRIVRATGEAIKAAERTFDVDAHHAIAKKAAVESTVLLKNEDHILPLAEGSKVALIGDFAKTPRFQGAGSSLVNATKTDSALDHIAESGLVMTSYAQGYYRNGDKDDALLQEAVEAAKGADTVLFFMGLDESKESEGIDRSDMRVNDNQIAVLRAVAEANARVIAVLYGGSAMETPWIDACKGVVYACLPGQAGGSAVFDVLTGKANPSGKLTESWPLKLEDTPVYRIYPGRAKTAEYREGPYIGYRYYETAGVDVRFPFGYGLSYTTFSYERMQVTDEGVTVSIKNTGDADGAEIVQMYVSRGKDRDPYRPAKELKGFARVFLRAGESKEVRIPFDVYTFRRFDVDQNRWMTDRDTWQVSVGANCADIRLNETYRTQGEEGFARSVPECYRTGKITNVSDADFETLLGRPLPDAKVRIDRGMTLGELTHGRSPIGWIVGAILGSMLKKGTKEGRPDLNLLFIYNMPLRALAKMTGGAISMGMVDGIVMEVKGFWIIGILRVIFEAIKNAVQNAQMNSRMNRS